MQPAPFNADTPPVALARHAARWLLAMLLGCALGVLAVVAWRGQWFATWDWSGWLALAILANALVALLPIWREHRRRRRQAELLRFRLWIHFSKLRWLLTHMEQQEPARAFFSPGAGGEELHGIEVLLAQGHVLEIDEYEWVIFTVNAALPYYGRPIGEMAPHAVRLLWTVDATLAQLSRPAASRGGPGT